MLKYIPFLILFISTNLYSQEYNIENYIETKINKLNINLIHTKTKKTQANYKLNTIYFNKDSIEYFNENKDFNPKEIENFILLHEIAHLTKIHNKFLYEEEYADIISINEIKPFLKDKESFINSIIKVRIKENYSSKEHNSSLYLLIYKTEFLNKEISNQKLIDFFKEIKKSNEFYIEHYDNAINILENNISFNTTIIKNYKTIPEHIKYHLTIYNKKDITNKIYNKKSTKEEIDAHIHYYNNISNEKFSEFIKIYTTKQGNS